MPWVNGTKLVAERGWHGITGNIYCGLHEYEPMQFLLDFLRPEDLFIDGGANMGSYTVLASAAVGCRTIAVEPLAELWPNIEANGIEEFVDVKRAALSSKRGMAHMTGGNNLPGSRINEQGKIPVQTITLDDLPTPDLLKLDIEGHEDEAVKGAERLLADSRLKAVLIESHGELLRDVGFRPYRYTENGRLETSKRQIQSMGIWIRDAERVQDRIEHQTRSHFQPTSPV